MGKVHKEVHAACHVLPNTIVITHMSHCYPEGANLCFIFIIRMTNAEDTGLAEGMPLIASISDKDCEVLEMCCTTREKAAIGLGTTAMITFITHRYLEHERFSLPYPSIIPGNSPKD